MRRRPGGSSTAPPEGARPEAWASRWATVDPGGPAQSSSESVVSSTATSTARAVHNLVTDAQSWGRSMSPRVPTTIGGPSAAAVSTAAAAAPTGQEESRSSDLIAAQRIWGPT